MCVSVSSCCIFVYMLTYVYECFIGKKSAIMRTKFSIYIENSYKGKLTIWEKWLYQLGVLHNIVVLPVARKRGNLLPDNIEINQTDSC